MSCLFFQEQQDRGTLAGLRHEIWAMYWPADGCLVQDRRRPPGGEVTQVPYQEGVRPAAVSRVLQGVCCGQAS
jgi:hypothetical protein